MPMKPNKKRRKEFRDALHEAQKVRQDRFTELMQAIAVGSRPCATCRIVFPGSDLDEDRVCAACRGAFQRISRGPVPLPKPTVLEPGVVWTDASWRDGIAGLAVVGALGEHSRATEARSSTLAEVLALRWAMEIARKGKVRDLTFRTDSQSAARMSHWGKRQMGWTVEQIPRRFNQRADLLAGKARLAA